MITNELLVALLEALVVVLMGWNIYTVIDVHRIREEFDRMKQENKEELERVTVKHKTELKIHAVYMMYISAGEIYESMQKYGKAFTYYASSLIGAHEAGDEDIVSLNLDLLLKMVETGVCDIRQHLSLAESKELAVMLSQALIKIPDKRACFLYTHFFEHSDDQNNTPTAGIL